MDAVPKTCILCKNFCFDCGAEDYSELTPGNDWEMSCNKDHYCEGGHDVNHQVFARLLLTADSCKDFVISESFKGKIK